MDILIETSDFDNLTEDELRDIENAVIEALESRGWMVASATVTRRGVITPDLPI